MKGSSRVRYAVLGLGSAAHGGALSAFRNAWENSELAALISGDPVKMDRHYEQCLRAGGIDAVYIALPPARHLECALRAIRAGIHVLCEIPLALSASECAAILAAAQERRAKLMPAYRLHFEASHLEAVELAQSGALGQPRFFSSSFMRPPPRLPCPVRLEPWELPLRAPSIARVSKAFPSFRG
ncbi:MAG: Gfo/Idh/MocA family oxidoreductase [Elusimicrobia bacterium]|nr:Gfo/Idh/MocA family oxidoreductase [Elusimicrobiota bacterium]